MKSHPTFPCGHLRDAASTIQNKYRAECRRCRLAAQAVYRQRARDKAMGKRVKWLTAPNFPAILAECRAEYEAEMAKQAARVGRPKKTSTTHSEAA